ncbi:MAG TPA: DUF4350 domain-containing protein [Pelolinea sp.]|nr:DUF4350 domain-containing protein [Pelolinea sp.]
MKNKRLFLALVFFLLPFFFRGLWFYRGFYFPGNKINSPDFKEITVIQPPLSTLPAVPVQASYSGIKVLFDLAHTNKFTFTEIEALRNLLLQQGAEILELEIKNDLTDLLNKADAFVVITPVDSYSIKDLEAVENFVQRGGRLLVIADPTRSYSEYDTEREKSVILANEILEPFKISFRNDYVYNLVENEGNYRNIFIFPDSRNSVTRNISQLVFYASHSLETQSEVLFTGNENTLSSLDDKGNALPVAAMDESGNVLVIGDMTFLTTPYNQVADNYQLVLNISDFLLKKSRTRTLADFPNLFTRPISIRLTEGINLDKELLAVISDMKEKFNSDDLPVVILEKEEEGFDQIILGTFPPNDQLRIYTDFFGINFNDGKFNPTPSPTAEDEIELEEPLPDATKLDDSFFLFPEFGKIPSEGFGFLLLYQEENRTNLVILSDSLENVVQLLNLLIKGSLEICLATDSIAICQQDAVYLPYIPEEEILAEIAEESMEEMEFTQTPNLPTLTPEPSETSTPS